MLDGGAVVAPGVPTPEDCVEAGRVIVVVIGAGAGPVPRASFTSAPASTASASAAATSRTASGICQRGVAAIRVRAAVPHCRHQSWSPASGAPQRGQRASAGTLWAIPGGASVAFTTPARRDG